jgi:hypothetical protein
VSDEKITVPPGLVAVTTWGLVRVETSAALLELRAFCEKAGLGNVLWSFISGGLVDKARNEAVRQMLTTQIKIADKDVPLGWIMFLDADMTFGNRVLDQMLETAYNLTPWADAVGAWCPLRGSPYLPTIDRGSGTWEPQDPGCGPLEVIRTGGACILIKRHVYERMEFPWYGVRPAPRPIDVLAEVDNYARCKMDGQNPLTESPAWQILMKCATEDAAVQRSRNAGTRADLMSAVGEDSNFCDRVRALGLRIVVNTDIVCGHVDTRVITAEDHQKAMQDIRRNQALVNAVIG